MNKSLIGGAKMATAIIARRPGLFRCSGIGQTVFAKAGEELPAHISCGGGCGWEFRDEDNPRPEMVTVIVGSGPFYPLIIREVPIAGDTINLKHGLVGSYRVMKVDTVTQVTETDPIPMWWPRIIVERVGNHEAGRPIHEVGYEVSL